MRDLFFSIYMAATIALCWSTQASAIPILTFDFEGIVNTVTGSPPGSPLVGDSVLGHFSYDLDSVATPHNVWSPELAAFYDQLITDGFSLSIGSAQFTYSDYDAFVANGVGPISSSSPPWDAFSIHAHTNEPFSGVGFQSTSKEIFSDVSLPLSFDLPGLEPIDAAGVVFFTPDGASTPVWRTDFTLLSISRRVSIPEPTTLALMALGLAGIGYSRRKTLH